MDPLLLAAMTLVTLTAGGVFAWLLVGRAQRGLAELLGPELGRLTADLSRLTREHQGGQERAQSAQAGLDQRLTAFEGQLAAGPRLEQIEAALNKASARPASSDQQADRLATELQRFEQRLQQQLAESLAKWSEPALEERLLESLATSSQSAEARWTTEAARWSGHNQRMEGIEAHLSALGGRLGEALEVLGQLLQAVRTAPAGSASGELQASPGWETEECTSASGSSLQVELESPQAGLEQALSAELDSIASESQLAPPSQAPKSQPEQLQQDTAAAATSGQPAPIEPQTATPLTTKSVAAGDSISIESESVAPQQAQATGPATQAGEQELADLEETSQALRQSAQELEAALNGALELAAVARAENALLRTAGQAELERIAQRYSHQIAAISSGLNSLDQALERTLATSASRRLASAVES